MISQAGTGNERGGIIIHVAFALIALLAFTALIVDQGVMYASRRQAQNAADAGALAGAMSLRTNLTAYAEADRVAKHFAGQTAMVWGEQTAVGNIAVSPLPFTCPAYAGGGNACIRVDVFRGMPDRTNTAHTNTLPTYFGYLVGVNSQGVRATATAQVGAGNSVSCIKPWVVVDKWIDNSGTGTNTSGWDQMDIFDPGVDSYARATPGPGSGFTATGANNDIGLQLMLKGDNDWSSGWSMRIELGGGNGSAAYTDEIQGCPSYVPEIGFYDGPEPCVTRTDQNFPAGCINVRPGVAQGPTVKQGVDYLVGLDSGASWNTLTNSIQGGCTQAGNCSTVDPEGDSWSPRVIPLALFDPQACALSSCQTGNNTVAQITNIMGFFLEGTCDDVFSQATMPAWCGTGGDPGKTVVGRIMNYPGQSSGVAGSAGPWSFIRVVRLVR